MITGPQVTTGAVSVNVGNGFTDTVMVAVLLQVPFDPVTVYIVCAVGLAVTLAPVLADNVADGDQV